MMNDVIKTCPNSVCLALLKIFKASLRKIAIMKNRHYKKKYQIKNKKPHYSFKSAKSLSPIFVENFKYHIKTLFLSILNIIFFKIS
jgi:hypothetical protein